MAKAAARRHADSADEHEAETDKHKEPAPDNTIVRNRWATIVKETGEVSNIQVMDGTTPERTDDAADAYDFEQVPAAVKIGMIRGGTYGAVGGFGFADELAAAGRSDTGTARVPADQHKAKSRVEA